MMNIYRSDAENVRINGVFCLFSAALQLSFVLTQIGEWKAVLHMIVHVFRMYNKLQPTPLTIQSVFILFQTRGESH